MWQDMLGDENPKAKRKLYITIGVLAILLLLIPLGVYLVRQTQIFQPKAVDEQISPETSFSLSGNADTNNLAVGQQFSVDLLVRSDFDPANVFNANINFPKDLIEVVGIEAPVISATFCGGIAGIACPTGFRCQLTDPVGQSDRAGVCVVESSGCMSDSECQQDWLCDNPSNGSGGVCRVGEDGFCQGGEPCATGLSCQTVVVGDTATQKCKPQAQQICSGPNDNSCPANYTCYQNCGAPVMRDNEEVPGYSCLTQAQIASREANGCPICLSQGTLIETPRGNIKVENLKEGMKVYSVDNASNKVEATILKVSKTPVNASHKMVNLVLEDGREIWISPNHPTTNNNQTVDQLKPGDKYDGSVVKSTTFVSYKAGFTYDLLPNTPSGFYFANGILMASTLKGSVKGLTVRAQESEGPCRDDSQCTAGSYCKSRSTCQTFPDGTAHCTDVIGGDCYPKPSGQACAQVITRACSNTDPQVCRDFPTPCDVPEGWVVTNQGRTACNTDSDCIGGLTCQENLSGCFSQDSNSSCNAAKVCRKPENPSGYFITEWVQKTFDNNAGTITLNGKSQGTKTNLSGLTMATIKFKAKKAGTGTISFVDSTQMLRLSDSLNILQTKRNLEFTVAGASPSPSASTSCTVNATTKNAAAIDNQTIQGNYVYPAGTKIKSINIPAQAGLSYEIAGVQSANAGLVLNYNSEEGLSSFSIKIKSDNTCTPFTRAFTMVNNCGTQMSDFIGVGSASGYGQFCVNSSPSPSPSASSQAGVCHGNAECSGNQYCQFVRQDCPEGMGCPAVMTGYCIANNGGKGDADNDGFIDLTDLSILYSSFFKNVPKLDFNNDRLINSFDYFSMVPILRSLNVIR